MKLQRLRAEGQGFVTRALARGEQQPSAVEYERFVEPCEEDVDLGAFDTAIRDLITRTERFDAGIDQLAAPLVHRSLAISRREAANPGVWRFLAVVHCPEFIRHRWEDRSWATTRTRYWQQGTRPDSNVFCRLWWIGELAHEGTSYALAERLLARQPLATAVLVRSWCAYRPALEAYVDVLEQAPPDEIEQVVRKLSGLLSTVVLEGQSRDDVATWLRRLRREVGG